MDEPHAGRCLARLEQHFGGPRYADAAMFTPATYSRVFHGELGQISQVRREVHDYLDGCLLPDATTDDAVLIVSEFSTNAACHSASAGVFFIVRVETRSTYVIVECEDLGGPWHCRQRDATRPHGLTIVEALTGPDGWGVDQTTEGGRVVWVRVDIRAADHG